MLTPTLICWYPSRSASPDGLQKRKTSDRIGRLRPEARMALRLESSMSKSLEDELHDSDAESAETPAEERDAVFQKRSESLTMIHQMVRVLSCDFGRMVSVRKIWRRILILQTCRLLMNMPSSGIV